MKKLDIGLSVFLIRESGFLISLKGFDIIADKTTPSELFNVIKNLTLSGKL